MSLDSDLKIMKTKSYIKLKKKVLFKYLNFRAKTLSVSHSKQIKTDPFFKERALLILNVHLCLLFTFSF